jgi:hypothetical protein
VAVAVAHQQRQEVVMVEVFLADLLADHAMAQLHLPQELLAKEIMVELAAVLQAMVLAAAEVQVQPAKVIKILKVAMEE